MICELFLHLCVEHQETCVCSNTQGHVSKMFSNSDVRISPVGIAQMNCGLVVPELFLMPILSNMTRFVPQHNIFHVSRIRTMNCYSFVFQTKTL